MKLKHIALPAVALLLAGCAGDDTTTTTTATRRPARYADRDSEPIEQEPRIGMSKGQIRQMYGEPESVNHSGRGEVWSYYFNRGGAFIPYNFGYRPRTGVFIFGENGRLKDYNWNE